jgi:hypothetical protein
LIGFVGRATPSGDIAEHWPNRPLPRSIRVHDEGMSVNATWSRNVGPVTILAFGGQSYTVMIGSKHKPPMIEIGWARWRPNFVSFPRLSRR